MVEEDPQYEDIFIPVPYDPNIPGLKCEDIPEVKENRHIDHECEDIPAVKDNRHIDHETESPTIVKENTQSQTGDIDMPVISGLMCENIQEGQGSPLHDYETSQV